MTPYRDHARAAPRAASSSVAPPASLWRRLGAWRRGVFLRLEAHRLLRRYCLMMRACYRDETRAWAVIGLTIFGDWHWRATDMGEPGTAWHLFQKIRYARLRRGLYADPDPRKQLAPEAFVGDKGR